MGVIISTGYFNVILILQVVGGVLLLSGISVPLGLTLLGPVIINIVMFHLFMDSKESALRCSSWFSGFCCFGIIASALPVFCRIRDNACQKTFLKIENSPQIFR
jgi:hypothetical protein